MQTLRQDSTTTPSEENAPNINFYQCMVCSGLGCFVRVSGFLMNKDWCPVKPMSAQAYWTPVIDKKTRGKHKRRLK
jgi:hypothetical protein